MGLFKKIYDTVTDVYDDFEDSVKDTFGANTGSGQTKDLT